MTGLLFALLATLLVGVGARDQVLVAQLAERQGARPSLLLVAIASGMAAAGLAAWGGAQVAEQVGGRAGLLLIALALALAGLEMLIIAPGRAPVEPTHSLGAFAIVVFAVQLTDAARFLVFAIGIATSAPLTTGLGGAVGAAIVVGVAWAAPGLLHMGRLRTVRRLLGGLLLVVAALLAPQAIG